MRVVYLINQYPKVSHTFIRREIEALETQGFEIERFSLRPMLDRVIDPADKQEARRTTALQAQPYWQFITAFLGLVVQRPRRLARALIQAISMGRRSSRGVLIHLIYLIEACWLARRLHPPTHLHVHFGTSSASVAYLCRQLGGPQYSLTIHSAEEYENAQRLQLADKISAAVFTISVCAYGREQLLPLVSPDRWPDLHIIRCSISAAFRDALLSPLPGLSSVVCIARLDFEKGHVVLLEALRSLSPENRPRRVVLVGDGPLRAELAAKTNEFGLQAVVWFAGWASEAQVRGYIEGAAICVVPSLTEVLPVTIMESFALGRPVIASNVGGIDELVCDGENGWLVPAGDAPALAHALRTALNTSTQRLTEMGRAGRSVVLLRHDAKTEAEKLAVLLRRAVE